MTIELMAVGYGKATTKAYCCTFRLTKWPIHRVNHVSKLQNAMSRNVELFYLDLFRDTFILL